MMNPAMMQQMMQQMMQGGAQGGGGGESFARHAKGRNNTHEPTSYAHHDVGYASGRGGEPPTGPSAGGATDEFGRVLKRSRQD